MHVQSDSDIEIHCRRGNRGSCVTNNSELSESGILSSPRCMYTLTLAPSYPHTPSHTLTASMVCHWSVGGQETVKGMEFGGIVGPKTRPLE